MRLAMIAGAALCLFASSGCVPLKLSVLGETVEPRGDVPDGCKFKGTVATRRCDNIIDANANLEKCEIALRNKAARKGGDAIVLSDPVMPSNSNSTCVSQTAKVYRCL